MVSRIFPKKGNVESDEHDAYKKLWFLSGWISIPYELFSASREEWNSGNMEIHALFHLPKQGR